MYKRCECNIYKKKTRRKYIYKKLQFFVFEYRIYFTFETINFNVPVSLVLCKHENIKVLSQLLVIFILYIEYPSFFFGLHPYFLIVLSAITNLSTMTVYCVKYVNFCICVQKQQWQWIYRSSRQLYNARTIQYNVQLNFSSMYARIWNVT